MKIIAVIYTIVVTLLLLGFPALGIIKSMRILSFDQCLSLLDYDIYAIISLVILAVGVAIIREILKKNE